MPVSPPPLIPPAPEPQPAPPTAKAALAAYRAQLAELTPRIPVTTGLVVVNLVVFAVMAAKGVSLTSPTINDLLTWGANFAPLSAGHQGWRLVTSMFVHVGLVHIALNMWVLWSTAQLVERMLGPAAFAVTYLLAGIAGSCVSATWNPDRVSAGASGAVFGLLGALVAFLIRRAGDVPPDTLKSLRRNAATLLAYNLAFGLLHPMVDLSAHVGGLVGGFVVAWFLVHATTAEARASSGRRTRVVLAAGLIAVGGVWALLPRLVSARGRAANLPLTQRQLPGAALSLPAGTETEVRTDYAEGHLRIGFPQGGAVALDWRTEEMLSEADAVAVVITPLTSALKATVAEHTQVLAGGQQGWRDVLKLPSGDQGVTLTRWPCGKRVFALSVGLPGHAAALEQRIRETFVCSPDPAQEGKAATVRVGVQAELGPDWGLVDDGKFLALTTLAGELYLVAPLASHLRMEGDASTTLMPRYLEGLGSKLSVIEPTFEATKVAGGPSPLWRGQGKRKDMPVRMLATPVRCEPNLYMVFYLGPRDRPEADALRLLSEGHCSATPTRPRPFADIAREACARGDKRGCN